MQINENSDGTMGVDVNALMESFSKDLRESNNDGFEVIYKVHRYIFEIFIIFILFVILG